MPHGVVPRHEPPTDLETNRLLSIELRKDGGQCRACKNSEADEFGRASNPPELRVWGLPIKHTTIVTGSIGEGHDRAWPGWDVEGNSGLDVKLAAAIDHNPLDQQLDDVSLIRDRAINEAIPELLEHRGYAVFPAIQPVLGGYLVDYPKGAMDLILQGRQLLPAASQEEDTGQKGHQECGWDSTVSRLTPRLWSMPASVVFTSSRTLA